MNLIPFALSAVRQHWRIALIVIVLLALTIQTFRLSATQGALQAEKSGRRADATNYARAQAEAKPSERASKRELGFLFSPWRWQRREANEPCKFLCDGSPA